MPPLIITILAWTGAVLSYLLTIPQAGRTLRSDRLDGLSATTYWIVFGNAAVWATFRSSPANTPQAYQRLSTVLRRCWSFVGYIAAIGRSRASLTFSHASLSCRCCRRPGCLSAPARSRAGEQEPGFGGIRLPLERVVMDVDTGDCHGPHCCSFRQAWISNSFYIVLIMN